MRLFNFRKETSERSDSDNWAKQLLIQSEHFFFDSIEGCNQNNHNQTTHLMERAHIDIDTDGERSKENVLRSILNLESEESLQRKINFAESLGLPLTYILHNDHSGRVFQLEFRSTDDVSFIKTYRSYEDFGKFLAEIKGWKSSKAFREYDDLPKIDQVLRKHGTPWPTNIDCFCSDIQKKPVAIIEYQNAKAIGVLNHSNNAYFLCKQKSLIKTAKGPKVKYHDDIRRWTSQEILRVQSELPLIVITWSQNEHHYQMKQVDRIAFPDFEMHIPTDRWKRMEDYKATLHKYSNFGSEDVFRSICNMKSMSFQKNSGEISEIKHTPALSMEAKTFPNIYWKRKAILQNDRQSILPLFQSWFGKSK